MKYSSTILIIISTFIALFFVFGAQNSDSILRLRRSHQSYYNNDLDCQNKCTAFKGMSCGKNLQNCCVPAQCTSGFWGSLNCAGRIAIPGCTDL